MKRFVNEDIVKRIVRSVIDEHMNRNVSCLGDYYKTPGLRELCHAVKEGNVKAINKAAKLLSKFVSSDCILVPIPSHYGFATVTRDLCEQISEITGCEVNDVVSGNRMKQSLYQTKLDGATYSETDFGYRLLKDVKNNGNIYLVDNVVDTGLTSSSVNRLFGNKAKILAIAKVNR